MMAQIISIYAVFALLFTVVTVKATATVTVNVTVTVRVTMVDCGLTSIKAV